MSPREPSPVGFIDVNVKPAIDEISFAGRPFDNILNFRDPDNASNPDRHRLSEELRLASVIDLRSTTEHAIAANRQVAAELNETKEQTMPSSQPGAIMNDEHLVKLPGVRRIMVSLAGWNLEKVLLWRLSWFNLLKAISLLASGYRNAATKLVVEQAMVPRGLKGLAHDTLTASQDEIKELFGYLSDPATYPTLIHCTQGKDRTGLVIILLLLLIGSPGSDDERMKKKENEEAEEEDCNSAVGGELCDVIGTAPGVSSDTDPVTGMETEARKHTGKIPLSAITSDYRMSEDELLPELEERLAEMQVMGLPEEYAKCPVGFTEDVVRFLEEGYGGIQGYLSAAGVPNEVVETVRELLTG
ncbi:hypothetical protein AJ78_05779 [Emergomyces pasteurianus Ep9510]|uniref:Tyrosine specific protein phosphatases domain-containing protein n=1 Tax=Emergomyces pasteurianus Ep9510 TaxID=1447872 RepID=A0A1J9QF38_9EURO|nr:hypothetical protein AJ78_05779 [Emergomyces pasteurianus Ep9510]